MTNHIVYLESVDSTNKYAADNFTNLPNQTIIFSQIQTAGKGRNGKIWHSPNEENIYASYIIKDPKFQPAKASWIGALAAINTLQVHAEDLDFWIKWPNDVYLKRKKIAGILCESHLDNNNKVDGVIIGMGININMSSKTLSKLEKPATSLFNEKKNKLKIEDIQKSLAYQIEIIYKMLVSEGIDFIFTKWKKLNGLINRDIEVLQDNGNILSAKAIDIDKSGELIIIDNLGKEHHIFSGDVSICSF